MGGRADQQVKFTNIPDTFLIDAITMSNDDLKEKYKKESRTIERWRHDAKIPHPPRQLRVGATKYSFPETYAKSYATDVGVIRIDGPCVVASDWHVPYHHLELAEWLIRVAEKFKIKQLAIPGDLLDAALFSNYDPHDIELNMKDEFSAVSHMLTHLRKWFTAIFIGLGNHDLRVLRTNKFNFDFDDIVNWITNDPSVHVTRLPYLYHSNDGDQYRLTHPGTYSRIGARTPAILADLFGCNVMSAHNHQWGQTRSASGRYSAIDLGCMADGDKIAYRHVIGDRTNPFPQSGFWTINNKVVRGYNLQSHWEGELGIKQKVA